MTSFYVYARLYWNPSTNYVDGACGVVEAAKDWGLSGEDVANAFREVNLWCRLHLTLKYLSGVSNKTMHGGYHLVA